jgi:membrane protein
MQEYKMTNSKNSTSLSEKFSSAMHKLKADAKNEWNNLWKVSHKELKTLFIISIYTFILIFLQIISNKWNFQEVLETVMKGIFGANNAISIVVTAILIAVVKYIKAKKNKVSEKYYLVSTTLLDRIAAISLAALGVSIPLFIFLQLFYPWIDDGTFSNEISRIKLLLMFLIVSSWFFGVNVIFKYFSEEIKSAREENRKMNDAVSVVFILLYTIFFVFPLPLLGLIHVI